MPLFFCHLRTERGLEEDDIGAAFPDLDEVYMDVCRAIPEMVTELLGEGRDPLRCSFEIADEQGRSLMEVPFSERLTKAAPRPRSSTARVSTNRDKLDELSALAVSTIEQARELRRSIQETRLAIQQTRLRIAEAARSEALPVPSLTAQVHGQPAADPLGQFKAS